MEAFLLRLHRWHRAVDRHRREPRRVRGPTRRAADPRVRLGDLRRALFLAFNVPAITMVLQYAKVGRWRDYLTGEKTYMVMSLVAKSLLAWQVWSGTLRPM